MKLTKLCYLAAAVLAAGLVYNASAWPDYRWTGLGGDNMWNNVANWTNLTTFTADLPENEATTLFAVQIDQANGSTQCIIPTGYTVNLNVANVNTLNNTVYGPEFGMNFNIYGTLEYAWMMAPVQNNPTPAARSIINMYNGSSLLTGGAGIGIGDAWWWYTAAPYVTLNMYGNAQMSVPNLAVGGHMNMYGTSTAFVTNAVFTTAAGALSDGTASLNLGGGSLMVSNSYEVVQGAVNNAITNLITRGVLRAYGKGYDTNDIIINTNGSDPVLSITVSAVPLGGALQRVYFQPLSLSSLQVGAFEQADLVGDYPSVSGALLSSSEPGVDPTTFTHPVYTSSNPNVVAVDTNGMVTAVGQGSATISASVGALNTTNSLSVTVTPVTASLIHRYSFNGNANDSVGSANGTLMGTATVSGGQLVLDGSATNSYVTLPAGIVSNLNEISVETWVSFNPTNINAFAAIFAFGNQDTANPVNQGSGMNYIDCQPNNGGSIIAGFGQGDPGNAAETDARAAQALVGQTNVQVVCVYHPLAGYQAVYTNGVLAASAPMFNNLIDPVAYVGPTYNKNTILNFQLGADPLNWIGQSVFTGNPNTSSASDPGFNGSIDEFRIYNGALSASQIAADNALGANQTRGTSLAAVSLNVTHSGGNVVFSWPTTSALVTLMSSPVLGPGASWTPVAVPNGAMTTSGGNYQLTLPISGTTRFFRLSE
jgi:Concanavalin A-like lectin/glucanases superfamily/Bacterial Ig-like domain